MSCKKLSLLHICMLICGSIGLVNVIWRILQQGGGRWWMNGKPTVGEWELSVRVTAFPIFTFEWTLTHSLTHGQSLRKLGIREPYGHVWSFMVPYSPVWCYMVQYCPVWSRMVPYGPV